MNTNFISEKELEEKRKNKQKEWEKVRKPGQPLEVAEEPYDHRSLYERLEEQKNKKQLEYEEAHKLKNMIKGLDDDEVEFLDLIDKKKIEAEQLKNLEEKQELLDFRKKVEKLRETSLDQRIQAEIQSLKSNTAIIFGTKSQNQLLKGIIKKRNCDTEIDKLNESDCKLPAIDKEFSMKKRKRSLEEEESISHKCSLTGTGLTCVGILPGLCSYIESSDDSDHSSSGSEVNDEKKYDLTGRQIINKSKEDPNPR